MADDRDMVLRFLNMVRGSLDEKNRRLLEELRLKRAILFNTPDRNREKPATPQWEEGQKGTDEPWKLPGQSSQQPERKSPPRPDFEKPKRKTLRDTVASSPGLFAVRGR